MKDSNKVNYRKNKRTIGYLTQGFFDDVSQTLWSGVADAARDRDVNLISFPGDRLRGPKGASSPANIVYELARDGFLDGFVSWASSVAGALTYEENLAFHNSFNPLPMVSIGVPMQGIP